MQDTGNKMISFFLLFLLLALLILAQTPSENSEELGREIKPSYPSGDIEITVITKGSSFTILPDSIDVEGSWHAEPDFPQGITLFNDEIAVNGRPISSSQDKTCIIAVNGGIACADSFSSSPDDFSPSVEWFYSPIEGGSFTSVATGGGHVCGIFDNGEDHRIFCWGTNSFGQIGNYTGYSQDAPMEISNPDSFTNWVEISAGESHTCAYNDQNSVFCWGLGSLGQIGNGKTGNSMVPTPVNFGTEGNISAIESGTHHNCMIVDHEEVWCWGWNGWGQLGTGSFEEGLLPKKVQLPAEVSLVELVLGPRSSCVLTSANKSICWGQNSAGQITDSGPEAVNTPTSLDFEFALNIFIGNDNICVLAQGGRILCEGEIGGQFLDYSNGVRQGSSSSDYLCLLGDSGTTSCYYWSNGSTVLEIWLGIGRISIPELIIPGQISGIPIDDYRGVHHVTSSDDDALPRNISLTVDFRKDLDLDGWSNLDELDCVTRFKDSSSVPLDNDDDGICDFLDWDDDNDGIGDGADYFPFDSTEWTDHDNDGVGHNADSFEFWEPTIGATITISLVSILLIAEIKRRKT